MSLAISAVLALMCVACEERGGYPFGFPFANGDKPALATAVEPTPAKNLPAPPPSIPSADETPGVRPKMIRHAQPDYPPRALRESIEGRVTVRFQIAPDGIPFNAAIANSSDPVFHEPALRALMRSRFEPQPPNRPIYAGRWFLQPYAFRLEAEPPAETDTTD